MGFMALDDIKPELDNYVGAKRTLIEAMVRAFRSGDSARAISHTVASAFSRDQVKQYLAAIALQDTARKAFTETGLDTTVGVWVTGIDAPREARLALAADPSEFADYPALPGRIREVLRDFHITLDPSQDENDTTTDAMVDQVLLDGEPVRLIKAHPRA
jgi:hypothetical protein